MRQRLAVQRKRTGVTAHDSVAPLERGGIALDTTVRAALEPRFGHDFSQVRIHADAEADRAAQEAGAVAFTAGAEIFFRDGAYAPEQFEGQHLLAHELTHVVQSAQTMSTDPAASQRWFSDRSDGAEQEAEAAAGQVAAGNAVQVAAAPSATIAREEEEPHHKGGWIDHLFGLNPDRSFVEAGLNPLIGQGGLLAPGEGDSTGTSLLKMAGTVAALPYIGDAAIAGHALDEINHGPLMLHGAFDW